MAKEPQKVSTTDKPFPKPKLSESGPASLQWQVIVKKFLDEYSSLVDKHNLQLAPMISTKERDDGTFSLIGKLTVRKVKSREVYPERQRQ